MSPCDLLPISRPFSVSLRHFQFEVAIHELQKELEIADAPAGFLIRELDLIGADKPACLASAEMLPR